METVIEGREPKDTSCHVRDLGDRRIFSETFDANDMLALISVRQCEYWRSISGPLSTIK